jgi:hypothetical protein
MYTGLHVKYLLFMLDFNSNFIDIFSKNPQMSDFMNILPLGAEFFADEQTYRDSEANGRFSKFCKHA